MTRNLYGLKSFPDDDIVIYVKASTKPLALKAINDTGGYQGHTFKPNADL